MHFQRDTFPHEHSAAFGRFKQHHTEINEMFWANDASTSATYSLAQNLSGADPLPKEFGTNKKNARRLAPSLGEWRTHYKSFNLWTKLNVIMAAASYFEIYFKTILHLSLFSKPGILLGHPTLIDGASILKHGNPTLIKLIQGKVIDCVKGDWNSRHSNLAKITGLAFPAISSNLAALDKIRKIRNAVGHSFGRDLEKLTYIFDEDKGLQPISDDRMKKYLKLLIDIAIELDTNLLNQYIGSFEVIYYYHKYILPLAIDPTKRATRLKTEFYTKTTVPALSKRFCRELVTYYSSL